MIVEVDVEIISTEEESSPYLSREDACMLDDVEKSTFVSGDFIGCAVA